MKHDNKQIILLIRAPTAPQKESTTKANWLFQQLVVQASVEHLNDNAESLVGFNKLLSKPPQTIHQTGGLGVQRKLYYSN